MLLSFVEVCRVWSSFSVCSCACLTGILNTTEEFSDSHLCWLLSLLPASHYEAYHISAIGHYSLSVLISPNTWHTQAGYVINFSPLNILWQIKSYLMSLMHYLFQPEFIVSFSFVLVMQRFSTVPVDCFASLLHYCYTL